MQQTAVINQPQRRLQHHLDHHVRRRNEPLGCAKDFASKGKRIAIGLGGGEHHRGQPLSCNRCAPMVPRLVTKRPARRSTLVCSDTTGWVLSKSVHRIRSQQLHKFSVGDAVIFTPGDGEVLKVATRGTVTRLLPKEGDDYQYHVQVQHDGPDRRARESQLRENAAPPSDKAAEASADTFEMGGSYEPSSGFP